MGRTTLGMFPAGASAGRVYLPGYLSPLSQYHPPSSQEQAMNITEYQVTGRV
jgi:hypothetical protein